MSGVMDMTTPDISSQLSSISKPALQRLAHVAGVKTISSTVFQVLREALHKYLERVLTQATKMMVNSRRKTIMVPDIVHSIGQIPGRYAKTDFINHNEKMKRCKVFTSTETIQVRGEKSLAEIQYYQGQTDCVHFSKSAFTRLVHRLLADIRIASNVVSLLQFATEFYLITVLENANLVAQHANRTTVIDKDVELVLKMINQCIE